MTMLWMVLGLAFAQQEACSEPYSRIQFGAAVGKVDSAYRNNDVRLAKDCLLYTSPSPRDVEESRMPSSA